MRVPSIGVGTGPPDCCCGLRPSTALRGCCCSTGRRGAIRATPGGLPGGARDSHETPEEAALREAHEEAGLPAEHLRVRFSVITAEVRGPGGVHWTYTTVVADAAEQLPTVRNQESTALSWVALEKVTTLQLHPGFAAIWKLLSSRL